MRRGVTLVEVMVALAVGMVLFWAIQDLLFKGSSLLESSHAHVEAAAGAQLLVEQIHTDARRLAPGSASISASGPPIRLDVIDAAGNPQAVEYGTAPGPSTGTLYATRNGKVLRGVVLKSLTIEGQVFQVGSGVPAYGFLTKLVATDGSGGTEFPLVDFTAVDIETLKGLDPYWVPNP